MRKKKLIELETELARRAYYRNFMLCSVWNDDIHNIYYAIGGKKITAHIPANQVKLQFTRNTEGTNHG